MLHIQSFPRLGQAVRTPSLLASHEHVLRIKQISSGLPSPAPAGGALLDYRVWMGATARSGGAPLHTM